MTIEPVAGHGASRLRVLDPRLDAEGEATQLAPALASLRGTVVGLLDNAKVGTARYFDHLEAILTSRFGVREVIRRRKPDASRPAPSELLGELSAADAIVSAVGD
jgi:hypothetical protein